MQEFDLSTLTWSIRFSSSHKGVPFGPFRSWHDYHASLGKDLLGYGRNTRTIFILWIYNLGGTRGRPKLHSRGGYFRPFIILKSLRQDPSNDFILSPLEVGLWVHGYFLTNYLKLRNYNNLRISHDSEFAKFWPPALLM